MCIYAPVPKYVHDNKYAPVMYKKEKKKKEKSMLSRVSHKKVKSSLWVDVLYCEPSDFVNLNSIDQCDKPRNSQERLSMHENDHRLISTTPLLSNWSMVCEELLEWGNDHSQLCKVWKVSLATIVRFPSPENF